MKRDYTLALSFLVMLFSCKKEIMQTAEETRPALQVTGQASTASKAVPGHSFPFHAEASGPFTIYPVSPTIVGIDQPMTISQASPFQLTWAYVRGFDDLTIPTFPDRFFDGTLRMAGQGNDSLFATITVQTSVFSDPVNPATGDFHGSEDFTGTYVFTGGTGHYLNATGTGSYSAHSEWRAPTVAGTFFSGTTTVVVDGVVNTVANNGSLQQQ